jgi:hypothetical protein
MKNRFSFFGLIALCLIISSCKPQTTTTATKKSESALVSKFANTLNSSSGQTLYNAIKSTVAANIQYLGQSNFYFGFWGDGASNVGAGNYINETADMSNIHYVSASLDGTTSDEWRQKIIQAQNKNHKVILMLEGALFKWASVDLNPSRDYILDLLKKNLVGLDDTIVGVYLIDEPYWKNSSAVSPLTTQDVYENLKLAAVSVKTYFPQATIMLTEAAPVIKAAAETGVDALHFPPNIDWIAANCYLYYDECQTVADLDELYHKVAMNLSANQKMFFTLEGHWNIKKVGILQSTQINLIQRNEVILKLSAKYPTVAYFPFLYQSQGEASGIADMPLLKTYFQKLWNGISDGSYKAGNPICVTLEPTCEGNDYIRRDTCGNELGRWANAPVPFCPGNLFPTPAPTPVVCINLEPKCEGKDWVRRDSCGKEVGRWLNAPSPYCPVVATPAPAIVCTILEPKCEGRDWVRRDSCGKELGRWVNAPKEYCPQECVTLDPKCEGKDWVRRDSCGKELGRWLNAPAPYCP